MVNDLNDNYHNKPKIALENSNSTALTQVTDNPLDDVSNSDDQTHNTSNPTGIISPPPFHTKRPTRHNKRTRFKFLPKRKQSFHHNTNHNTSIFHPSTVQNSTLPNYSTVTTTLLTIMTMKALSKFFPKQITLLLRHLFILQSYCLILFCRTLRLPLQKEKNLKNHNFLFSQI